MSLMYRYRSLVKGNGLFAGILFAFFAFVANDLKAQESFKIGDFFEVYDHDSITVAYNTMGRIEGIKYASFIRKGKRDPLFMNVVGDFKDYDMKGNLVFKGTMVKNYLNGAASYYYANGVVKEEGQYKDDVRIGTWKFYYPNGKVAKLITFDNGEMVVNEVYAKNGKQEVKDGNGKTKLDISKFRQPDLYEVSGTLKNGKLDGTWTLFAPDLKLMLGAEVFKEGRFIYGESIALVGKTIYMDDPRIVLKTFQPNEAVDFSEGVNGYPKGIQVGWWDFNGGGLQETNIYRMLLDSIVGKYKGTIEDQWIIVGFKINENGSLSDIHISSSSHDEVLNQFIYDIMAKSSGWKPGFIDGKRVKTDVFFSLVVKEKKIVLPAFFRDATSSKLDKTWERVLPDLPAYDQVNDK